MIDTRIQWLKELERVSSLVSAYQLSLTLKDVVYVERPAAQPVIFHDSDAYNVANSAPHNAIVADAVAALQGKMPEPAIQGLLNELTFRKTYGAFSEVMAYKWLGDAGVDFEAQVPMTKADVVNPNGSIIDGKVALAGRKTACFDIKAFGFVAHKIRLLQKRLEDKLPGKSVLIEGAWHVSIDTLQDLHDHPGFSALLAELQTASRATRGPLTLRAQNQQRITVSMHESDPLALAKQNRDYPMRFASQYARNMPFLLMFVIHPWFSQGELHQNFGSFVDTFTEELSRLAFFSFEGDKTFVEGIPREDAARLLSGLVFLNGWPAIGTDAPRPNPFCRIFLNGSAKHGLEVADLAQFKRAFGDGLLVKRLAQPGANARLLLTIGTGVIVAAALGSYRCGYRFLQLGEGSV
jgi:hypothetical protein